MEVKEASAAYAALHAEQVPHGYKKTEVGVVPEDWDVLPLSHLGTWKGGATPSMQNPLFWEKGSIPWVSSGDVKSTLLFDAPMKITNVAVKNSSTTLLPSNSIIVVTRSGILRKYLPVAMNVCQLAINQDIKALIPSSDYFSGYLLHLLSWSGPRILSNCLKSGTTVESIEFRWLKSFSVPVPPTKAEQAAIAEALSDADALIASLEQLLAKKRHLKQGAMQQLLTGRTRLPQFAKWEDGTPKGYKPSDLGEVPDDWGVVDLGELLDLLADYTANGSFDSLKNNVTYYSSINYAALVRTTDLDKQKFIPERFTDKRGYDFLEKTALYGGEIVIANVGSVGKAFRVPKHDAPMTLAPNTYLLKFDKVLVDEDYIFHWMRTDDFVQKLLAKVGSTTLLAINKDNLRSVELVWPHSKEEQTAIATILSDMDAELAALEEKLAKARALKQGMMQELLTGRIRLVRPTRGAA